MFTRIETYLQDVQNQGRRLLARFLYRDQQSEIEPSAENESWRVRRGWLRSLQSITLSLSAILLSLWCWWGSSLRKMHAVQETERLYQKKAMSEAVQKLTLDNAAKLQSLSLTEKDLHRLVDIPQESLEQTWKNFEALYGLENLRVQKQADKGIEQSFQLLTVSFRAKDSLTMTQPLVAFLQRYASIGKIKTMTIQKRSLKEEGARGKAAPSDALGYDVHMQVLLFHPKGDA